MVAEIDRRGNLDSDYISGLTPRDIGHYWVRHWRPDWMKEWTFHDLRHAAAGLLYLMTRSEQAVRIILGHSSTSITLSYIADESAPTRDAFQMLDEVLKR
jgi:integrase